MSGTLSKRIRYVRYGSGCYPLIRIHTRNQVSAGILDESVVELYRGDWGVGSNGRVPKLSRP
jgi:hypothetical protein